MSNPFVQYETEWDIILRKHGIKQDSEDQVKKDLEAVLEEVLETADPHEHKSLSQLRAEEEEARDRGSNEADEEADYLAEYRKNRLRELQERAKTAVFGTVTHIRKSEWQQAITEVSKQHAVVVLLYEEGHPNSDVVVRAFKVLAPRYAATKFVMCYGREAVENLPRENMPTILIYMQENPKQQFVGISKFVYPKHANASHFRTDFLEWELARCGAISAPELEMPEEYEQLSGMSSRGKKTSGKGKFGETDVEDENEEDGDDDGVYVEFRRK